MSLRSALFSIGVAATFAAQAFAAAEKPNVILILVDDMGWSDLGCYGGEISTPTIDSLAADGVRFRQFYNAARCSPTRCALLTGLYTQQVAVDPAAPLPNLRADNNVTIAELLKSNGYRTYMAGKWHLGGGARLPENRGFDHVWRFSDAGAHSANFWNQGAYQLVSPGNEIAFRNYTANGQQFYQTDAIGDYSVDFINHSLSKGDGKPFFIYMAFGAPHFPLQAPAEVADKYTPIYEKGWDVLREERFQRQLAMGVIDERYKLTPRGGTAPHQAEPIEEIPAWNTLPAARKADLVRRMSLFAAMIEEVDRNVAKVIRRLEETGQLDNTLILFLSDNGGNHENGKFGNSGSPLTGAALANMGQPGVADNIHYGGGWANLSNTPLRLFKHSTHEGGIRTPLIVHWPAGVSAKNVWREQPGHIVDILPTIAAATGATYPTTYAGHPVLPFEGRNLLPQIQDGTELPERSLYVEHEVNRTVQRGIWKLVTKNFMLYDGSSPAHERELYNIVEDPCETNNIAASNPEVVRALVADFNDWAQRAGVPQARWLTPPPRNLTPGETDGDLFVDTFNRPNAMDIDTTLTGVWGRRVPPIAANATWFEGFEGSGTVDSIQVIDNVLQMATGLGMSENGLNHNFVGQNILDAGGFSVSLDVLGINTEASDSANRFVGFGVGLNAAQAAAGNDIGSTSPRPFRGNGGNSIGVADCFVELDLNGNVKVWTRGVLRATVPVGRNTGNLLAAFECDSFAAGATVTVSVYFDGSRLDINPNAPSDTLTFTWDESSANYIGLSARASVFALMDNFAVRLLPLADALTVQYGLRAGLDGEDARPDADKDDDRSSNRDEWIFGTNPNQADELLRMPVIAVSGASDGIRLRHRRLSDFLNSGIRFHYAISSDLKDWQPVNPSVVSVNSIPSNPGYEEVELLVPESAPANHERLFIRVHADES